MRELPIVAIEWLDAVARHHSDWRHDCNRQLSLCVTIGALAFEDDEKVVLLNHIAPSGDTDFNIVPKAVIKRRKALDGFLVELDEDEDLGLDELDVIEPPNQWPPADTTWDDTVPDGTRYRGLTTDGSITYHDWG